MSGIGEFAITRNTNILINARQQLDDCNRASLQSYEYLILNHIGALLSINESEYTESLQYQLGELLKSDQNKALQKLEVLSSKGFTKASRTIARQCIGTKPELALQYFKLCLNDENIEQGEILSSIGDIYINQDDHNYEEAAKYYKIAADTYDEAYAQGMLSVLYFHGSGVERDIEISFDYCKKGASNGDAECLYRLGRDYIIAEEYPLDINYELGIKYLLQAALKNHGNAQYVLGLMYFSGEGLAKDITMAKHWFELAMKQNVPGVYSYLGQIYFDSDDYEKAKEMFEIAYYQHDLMLCIDSLVKIYKNGLGCRADIPRAVHLIEDMISKDLSNIEDIEFVANSYYSGNDIGKDIDKAVRYYRLIEDNNPSIKFKLGCIAFEGSSTILSKNDCIRYFEYAGNNGYASAFSKLANYYVSVNNYDRALDYYKRSFQSGNIDDGVLVGRIYEAGTPSMYKNMNEAVNWYKVAAEKGSEKAKEELSHIKSGLFGYKRIK